MMRSVVPVLLGAAILLTAGSSLARANEREFYAPGHRIECATSDGSWHGAMCQTLDGKHYALLHATGKVTICSGRTCPYSNAAENTPTLARDTAIRAGRFRCRAAGTTIVCSLVRSGRGFVMTPAGAHIISA